MKTIDDLLSTLIKHGVGKFDKSVPVRDKKILISLDKQIGYGNFLTKNQGDLLIKIFKENEVNFKNILGLDYDAVITPTWSKPFRVIQPVRKIYRKKDNFTQFVVEFTWNKRLQQHMVELNKELQGTITTVSNKTFVIPLTEKNIYLVVSKFKPLKFEISTDIEEFYQEIKEIIERKDTPNEIDFKKNIKIFDRLMNEIDHSNISNSLLLQDRQIRYQYRFSSESVSENLVYNIAGRSQPRVWIKDSSHTLTDLISSLYQLGRLPILLILSGHESADCLEKLIKFNDALKFNEIEDTPSVYFRFDNTGESNVKFNTFVNENNFNKRLHSGTKVVVLANNKLPKFVLQSNWYPKSVISFTNNFRTNKTSVWCDAVDLQIYYTERQPIIGGSDVIL